MMIKRTTYPGWNKFPVYIVYRYNDYKEVCRWMLENCVESFMVSSGSSGYIFQVKSNLEWFILKWEA